MTPHRTFAAVGLFVGPVLFAVGDLLRRLVVPGSAAGTVEVVGAVHQHPHVWAAAALASIAGSMLAVPGVLRITADLVGRGARLATVGGYLLALGWFASIAHAVGYFGLYGLYASSGVDARSAAVLDEAADRYLPLAVVIILFMAGAILGQILWFAGLARAKRVPAWTVLAAVVDVVAGATGGVAAGVVGVLAWGACSFAAARALTRAGAIRAERTHGVEEAGAPLTA
jgi:hypothetical protein